MTFSNPAGGNEADAARYVGALLDLLGERDPLAVQRELPGWLTEFLSTIPADALETPEAPGKWSVSATVRHLAHTESVYVYRYRVVRAQEQPVIPGFDQDAWAQHLPNDPPLLHDAVDLLTSCRRWNLSLLERLSPEDLQRAGTHDERGVETLDQLIRLGAAHDLVHRAQLERIRSAVT